MNYNDIMRFKQNPMAITMQRFNIPQGIQNPQDIIQHLLDSGQISQSQLNNAMYMRNNPQVMNFLR